MAAIQRGQRPIDIVVPTDLTDRDLPPISAMFLIYFDIKAGYTLGWKRALPGIELEGAVEYKSLPSGLHTVKEDLIYFVHENHAGLSAFINVPAAEESRNVRMIAVGLMVPLSYGRLGRSWKHAQRLKEMASELITDTNKIEVLEEYWEEHRAQVSSQNNNQSEPLLPDSPSNLKFKPIRIPANSRGDGRKLSVLEDTAIPPPLGPTLSAHHPAWSLKRLLKTFGPLIFPIHRAALLRKRILIIGHAPVQETCTFVYDISIISSIPLAVSEILQSNSPSHRLRPLFSIGVHDIPLLEEDLKLSTATTPTSNKLSDARDEYGSGWIACTTDSILSMKSALYDVLIYIPRSYSEDTPDKAWPKIESPQGTEMRATQRDLRRYKSLCRGLSRHRSSLPSPTSRSSAGPSDTEVHRASFSSASILRDSPMVDLPDTDSIIEPVSWSALAYSGFMWWASAGEERINPDDESEAELLLLSGLSICPSTSTTTQTWSHSTPFLSKNKMGDDMSAQQEMAIIAYFHRLTTQVLTTLGDIIDAASSDDDERDDEDALLPNASNASSSLASVHQSENQSDLAPPVYVTSADIATMGLDVWSAADHRFIEEIAKEYFGRIAQLEARHNIEVCGIRIC